VAGPLNIQRSRQGQPVIFQAGDSSEGRDFAAAIAEGTYTNAESLEQGQEYYRDLKNRAAARGRNPDQIMVLPGLTPIIADTDEEAERIADARIGKLDLQKALVQLGRPFNYHDFSQYELDAPFPALADLTLNSYKGHAERIIRVARQEGLTLRETAWRFAARRQAFVGSPATVAAEIERWFVQGACDGFNFRVTNQADFALFTDRVVPILQARGLFRTAYESHTLRGHLGLSFPENRYTAAKSAGALEAA
jgi:alkanesulfonate monooxygenase SsuD/methylene tetrahydromethanopterin reductase-like flavin-dependent oxidoreductase (luciferase family)